MKLNVDKVRSLGGWIPKKDVMEFLGYKETQMNSFVREFSEVLKVSRIGRRCFIEKESIIRVFELNQSKLSRL